MGARVSDEVWRGLDQNAGRLGRRAAARAWIASLVAIVLWFAAYLVWTTGVVVPQLVWFAGLEATHEPGGVVRVRLQIANHGLASLTVLAVGRSGPGMQLRATEGPLPATLVSGAGVEVVLVYRITDCAAVPVGSWPVAATVERFWGALTTDVQPAIRGETPWQEDAVRLYCDR